MKPAPLHLVYETSRHLDPHRPGPRLRVWHLEHPLVQLTSCRFQISLDRPPHRQTFVLDLAEWNRLVDAVAAHYPARPQLGIHPLYHLSRVRTEAGLTPHLAVHLDRPAHLDHYVVPEALVIEIQGPTGVLHCPITYTEYHDLLNAVAMADPPRANA
jgi:hypothetical protein